MKKLIPLIIISFLIISCDKGKDIVAVDSNYVGGWYGAADSTSFPSGSGEHAELVIDSQNNLNYKTYAMAGDQAEDISGTATIIGNRIRINQSIVPYYLTIVSPLTHINSNMVGGLHWTITLKGQFYTYAFYRQ